MKKDFSKVDAAILERIKDGKSTFTSMFSPDLKELLQEHSTIDRWGYPNNGRILDRRLQALRKAGKIVFNKGKWMLI